MGFVSTGSWLKYLRILTRKKNYHCKSKIRSCYGSYKHQEDNKVIFFKESLANRVKNMFSI